MRTVDPDMVGLSGFVGGTDGGADDGPARAGEERWRGKAVVDRIGQQDLATQRPRLALAALQPVDKNHDFHQ